MTSPTSSPDSSTSSKPSRSRRRVWRWFALLLVLFLLCVGWNRAALLQLWGRTLNVGRPLTEPVDVVFVLGGGVETRPFVAAEIYLAGYAKKVLISQPQRHSMDFLGGRSEADLTREILERQGVPAVSIEELPLPVDSTTGEVDALRDYLNAANARPVESVAVVTSDFHTRRAHILLNRALKQNSTAVRIVSAPVDGFSPQDWWRYQRGLATYLLETVKLMTVLLNLA